MKRRIIISPWARRLPNYKPGVKHPKDYPWWPELIQRLHRSNVHTIQVGIRDEEKLNCHEYAWNLSFAELQHLLSETYTWISVDNFFHHFAHLHNKPGYVIYSLSDPLIFGYPDQYNILKDRKYLRPNQFDIWKYEEYNESAFPSPKEVLKVILRYL